MQTQDTDPAPLYLQRPGQPRLGTLPFQADGPTRGVIVFSSAMGVRASYYIGLAQALAARGLQVWLGEQRGHGISPVRPSRRTDYGYRELIEEDLAHLVDHARKTHPGLPLIVAGHSLGGQVSTLYAAANPDNVDGLILIGAASPYFRNYPTRVRRQLRVASVVFPACNAMLGYYPGARFGLGGRESRGLIRDWLRAMRHDVWRPEGARHDYESCLRQYSGKVLNISTTEDTFAPHEPTEALLRKLPRARITRLTLGREDLGDAPPDHFAWARKAPEQVAERMVDWLYTSDLLAQSRRRTA